MSIAIVFLCYLRVPISLLTLKTEAPAAQMVLPPGPVSHIPFGSCAGQRLRSCCCCSQGKEPTKLHTGKKGGAVVINIPGLGQTPPADTHDTWAHPVTRPAAGLEQPQRARPYALALPGECRKPRGTGRTPRGRHTPTFCLLRT